MKRFMVGMTDDAYCTLLRQVNLIGESTLYQIANETTESTFTSRH
jgi:hypothetical protein